VSFGVARSFIVGSVEPWMVCVETRPRGEVVVDLASGVHARDRSMVASSRGIPPYARESVWTIEWERCLEWVLF
jgi:hypothetical protein